MSIQALNWAINQRAGSPSGKAVLWSIANYCNEHGCAWPSQSLIAEESEQSTDSVSRRLLELVERGLIRRLPLTFGARKSTDFFIIATSKWFRVPVAELTPVLPRGFTVASGFFDPLAGPSAPETPLPQNAVAINLSLPQNTATVTATVREHEPSEPEEEREAHARGEEQATVDRDAAFEKVKSQWPIGALDDVTAARVAWERVPVAEFDAAANFVPQFMRLRKDAGRTKAIGLKSYITSAPWARPEVAAVAQTTTVELTPFVRPLWAILWARVAAGANVAGAVSQIRTGVRLQAKTVPTEEQEKRLRPATVNSEMAERWMSYAQKLGFALPMPPTGVIFLPEGDPPTAKLRYAWKAYNLLTEVSLTICSKSWWWRVYAKNAPIPELIDAGRRSRGSVKVEGGPLPSAFELMEMVEVKRDTEQFAEWSTWFTAHGAAIIDWPDQSIWTPSEWPKAVRA